jgi:hypothetical protein
VLPDSQEVAFGTDPCRPDSDGDHMTDWWEVQSALDLNSRASFPPAKRPWPNPNWGGDATLDFDQDGLPAAVEADLWMRSGSPVELTYSDGDQSTTTSADPIGQDHDAYNTLVTPSTEHLNMDGDRILSDDEKDFDGDGLTNWDEVKGRLNGDWWTKRYTEEAPFFGVADVALTDALAVNNGGGVPMYADPDIDGDGVLDGADDQDHDGWSNAAELYRGGVAPRSGPSYDLDGDGTLDPLTGNPFNPCLPDRNSRACTLHPPFGGGWAPFEPVMSVVTIPAGGPDDRSRPQELVPLQP